MGESAIFTVLVPLLAFAAGSAVTWATLRSLAGLGLAAVRADRQALLAASREEATALKARAELDAREAAYRLKEDSDRAAQAIRDDLRDQARRLEKRADLLDQKVVSLDRKEADLEAAGRVLAADREALRCREAELTRLVERAGDELQRVAGLGRDDARAVLLDRLERELAQELGGRILRSEQAIKEASEHRAREILATVIQRYAAGHTAETTTSTVDIPSDEMKGRIIGREGRNIRAFEKATGVDVIVDDTPGVVIVSCFDSIRRGIARISLEKLIQDGRIHPARIEEIVAETREEMDRHLLEVGQAAALEADVPGLHEKLIGYLGRLRYRTSYSQNVLKHSIEVAFLTGMMAEEIGLDGALGRRCGLLHDLGKAADHEMEGGHPAVGAELLKRQGESKEVVHAALGHHDDLRHDMPYTVLVAAADAVSASRPGARRDTLEKYVRRLEELETLVGGFPGVDQAYALQAGREVRVLVDSGRLSDEQAAKLSRDVALAIQEQLTYPGEVKVTVLRETRAVAIAR